MNKKSFFRSNIVFLIFIFILWFLISESYVPLETKYQIVQIIKKQDIKEIDRITTNKKTKNFLIGLKNNGNHIEVAGFQGGSKEVGYYPTNINGKNVGVYTKKVNFIWWKIEYINKEEK
ncbi:hypothetical protein [Lactobacillus xylocopicola]|uniref:Uncharacterized protein n=1 Tax=Lactobacillus xylocopicola TaxID=2976676 RepID=A0ABM8BEU5_9LACO|nr:hypothetical protein [Lactobacillus xylocopicola]BDR59765.1 hypothetical protein KIM322_00260 [Lactobacillus xylocopicola]